MKTDGERLEYWLKKLKIKKLDFADKIGVTRHTVRNLTLQDRFNGKQITQVLGGLNITEDEFFGVPNEYEFAFIQEIERLADLMDRGALTKEEFTKLKTKIIQDVT